MKQSKSVAGWIESHDNPVKEVVQRVRDTIRHADERIREAFDGGERAEKASRKKKARRPAAKKARPRKKAARPAAKKAARRKASSRTRAARPAAKKTRKRAARKS